MGLLRSHVKNDLFSEIIRVRFCPCAKFSWTNNNHAPRAGLVFDLVGWGTLVVFDPGLKKKLILSVSNPD